jgi:hypothetical protein
VSLEDPDEGDADNKATNVQAIKNNYKFSFNSFTEGIFIICFFVLRRPYRDLFVDLDMGLFGRQCLRSGSGYPV